MSGRRGGGGGERGGGRYTGRGDARGGQGGARGGGRGRGDEGRGGGRGRGDEGGRRDHGGGRGRGRGDGGRGGPPQSITSALSNLVLADVTPNFKFYLYGLTATDKTGTSLDSRLRRATLFRMGLWDKLLKTMPAKEKESLMRVVFFAGSFFFSDRPIPGLEASKLPLTLVDGTEASGDCMIISNVQCYTTPEEMRRAAPVSVAKGELQMDRRCASCTNAFLDLGALMAHCQATGHSPVYQAGDNDEKPRIPNAEIFTSYCNMALQKAMGERMARWGRDFIDPKSFTEPTDRNGNSLGVRVYEAYSCQFGLIRPGAGGPARLALTIDLKAKVLRNKSVLDALCEGQDPNTCKFSKQQQDRFRRTWIGETVISTYDKICYTVLDLVFDHSAASMPVEGLKMSHQEYFQKRKNIALKYPNAKPMIAVEGRRKSTIHLPAELICGNELEPFVKMQLPMIASYKAHVRNKAIDEMKRYLKPGAQKTKGVGGGLLPAIGIVLQEERLTVKAEVLPLPVIVAAGVTVPSHSGQNWAPMLAKANFRINPKQAVNLNVVVVHHDTISRECSNVYGRIRDMVNEFSSTYRFTDKPLATVVAGDMEKHWGAVEKYFGGSKIPSNIFVIDLSRPRNRAALDPAYSVVKQMLSKAGYLSQFVNFNTYDHGQPRDMKRSNIILHGVARQILSKCGVRIWWVNIPRSLPLPAVFVGIDVYHAPRKYNAQTKTKSAKASCAAIIVQVVRQGSEKSNTVEIYSETFKRSPGMEYDLGDAMQTTLTNALKYLKVNPASCVVWRDGVGDAAIEPTANQEVPALRRALRDFGSTVGAAKAATRDVPLAYIVCQKRIATKFITRDGQESAPSGTLVQGIQGLNHSTFYLNGRSPPYSTAKPVRFIITERDQGLATTPMTELTWALCHDYPNWSGPIKVPGPVQMAHKLAELAGNFADCGESIESKAYMNRIYFL